MDPNIKARKDDLPARSKEEINTLRNNHNKLQNDKLEQLDAMRNLARQVPLLAGDFEYEVDKRYGNIEVLLDLNLDLKGDLICLKEEKEAEKLQGKLLDSQLLKNQYEV